MYSLATIVHFVTDRQTADRNSIMPVAAHTAWFYDRLKTSVIIGVSKRMHLHRCEHLIG